METLCLSHLIGEGMPLFPGTEPPSVERIFSVEKDHFAETRLSFSSHTGTHMDAPAHMIRGGKTLDQYDPGSFTGPGALIDVTAFGGEEIPLDIFRHNKGDIRKSAYLLLYTGWDRLWGRPGYFENYPVLAPETALWLVSLPLKGIGIDAPSFDPVEGSQRIHHILLGKGLLLVENLTGLERVKGLNFSFSAFPLLYKEADGAPVYAKASLFSSSS
ncbi:cyclase family protein [Candidatus Mcinerneyibacteriota bacterium]|nr:cyclase family protein [Candidatus Mcinerneyibacteriota bacterium]